MKVLRKIKIKAHELELMVNDQIKVKLKDGRKYTLTAVQKQEEGMLFVFDECVDRKALVNEGDYVWKDCDLRKWLNNDFYNLLPKKFTDRLVLMPVDDDIHGDWLTLLTSEQFFGIDANGNDVEGQIEYFKSEKNRVAEFEGETAWYWTKTPYASYSYYARYVRADGSLYYGYAYVGYYGVRPACLIRMCPKDTPKID